ncbi:MAG: serine/threonine protein kinase [Acidobacteria bacterium]|nr:serine/threonine protein kinase [Acidobacteriota bacterium]MBI3425214.1 serine/threonine protein kinase [Acidobacteriota bacterium]
MKFCPQCQKNFAVTLAVCPADGTALALKDTYGLSGRVIADKYQIGELAALGGMSAVYHAHQIGVKRHVAFKILLPNLALEHPRMLDRFEREAHLAGRLTHENIAIIHDAGQTPDSLAYIVMEWLDGELLESALQQRYFLSYQRIAYLLRQIAAALDAAHAARVIHRDLKPTNIMIVPRPDGRDWVKVFDFGLAKVLADSMDLQISHALGTPHYASPEQFRPGEEISGQSDIYSLGIILYRLLTRHVPFDAPDIHELIRLHLLEVPPPLARWRPAVPTALEQLVARMLAKTPHYRPATATEAVDLFDEIIQALPAAERERELPVKSRSAEQAKLALGTHPLTPQRGRKQNRAASTHAARHAADFNEVRQTKQLTPPAPVAPAAQDTVKPVNAAPTAPNQPRPKATSSKKASSKKAAPKKANPPRLETGTLLLIGLVTLLLVALAGYFFLHRNPILTSQHTTPATSTDSASHHLTSHPIRGENHEILSEVRNLVRRLANHLPA